MENGILNISGTGAMADYNDWDEIAPWGAGIKEVIVGNGVTTVGDFAFFGCSNLVTVTLSEGVASIGNRAFYRCTSLTSVTLPTHCKTLGRSLFEESTTVLIEGKAIPFVNGYVSYSEQLTMILDKDYAVQMSHDVKYPLLWKLYAQNPDDPELLAYIKKNFSKMFPVVIKENNVDIVTTVCESEKLLTKRNIDKMINLAIENTQNGGNLEIQVILTNYKYEKLGFKKDAFSSFKL